MIFFSFFQKNPSLKKKLFSFRGGEGKGGEGGTTVSEFFTKNPNLFKKIIIIFLGGDGGGRRRGRGARVSGGFLLPIQI